MDTPGRTRPEYLSLIPIDYESLTFASLLKQVENEYLVRKMKVSEVSHKLPAS